MRAIYFYLGFLNFMTLSYVGFFVSNIILRFFTKKIPVKYIARFFIFVNGDEEAQPFYSKI